MIILKAGFFFFIFFSLTVSAVQSNETRILQKSTMDSKVHGQSPSVPSEGAAQRAPDEQPESLDRAVVSAFLIDDCAQIFKLVPEANYRTVGGRVLALTASCNPPGKDPEKMFSRAHELSPEDSSILLLQARYRSKKQMVTADNLWNELLAQSQDPKVRAMADLYLKGDSEAADAILLERKGTFGGFVQIGSIYEGNPNLTSVSEKDGTTIRPSFGTTSAGLLKYDKPFSSYSLGVDYFFAQTAYSRSHESDLISQELGFPITINATREASLIVRPYVTDTLLGSKGYLSDIGASMTRADPLGALNQTVCATFYYEHYFDVDDQPQQGPHLKIEYGLHPHGNAMFDVDLLFYIDHGSEGQDETFVSQTIPYSNFTYSGFLSIASKGRTSFGLNTTASYRVDDSQSSFVDITSLIQKSKKREDVTVQIQPFISMAITNRQDWAVITAYQYSTVSSNIGSSDYLDRNSINQAFSLSLRHVFDH
jgi:hypothetical protein